MQVTEDVFYVRPDLVLVVDTSRSTRQYRRLVEALSDKLAADFLNSSRQIAVVNFARGYNVLGFTQDQRAIKKAANTYRSDERYDAATSLPSSEIASLIRSGHETDTPVAVAYVMDSSVPRDEFAGLLDHTKPDATLAFLLECKAKKAPFWRRPFRKYPQRLSDSQDDESAAYRKSLVERGAHVYSIRNMHDIDGFNFDDVSVPITLPKNRWFAVG